MPCKRRGKNNARSGNTPAGKLKWAIKRTHLGMEIKEDLLRSAVNRPKSRKA